ncbi:MAG: DUF1302 domain-containing protein [Desulfuromonadales bacterium]
MIIPINASRPVKRAPNLRRRLVQSAICMGLLNIAQTHAFPLTFDDPSWEGYIDTTFTASAAMRVQGADHKGTPPIPGPGRNPNAGFTTQATGRQTTFADAGDIYSSPLSFISDIGLKKGDYGFFTRLSYIYDYTIMNKDCTNCERPTPAPSVLGQALGAPRPNGIADDAQTTAGNKFRVLDFFVYGNWDIGEHPLNARVGKQVVNWGESNILGGGISQMQNPVDLGKTTVPGTEVKETLMPQELVYASFGLTDSVAVEAYYVWNWRNTIMIPVGTLFNPGDNVGTGYNPDLLPGLAFAGRDEPDGGQWGVALHKIIDSWNGADLGLYWVRSHGFNPYIGYDPAARHTPYGPGDTQRGGYKWIYPEDQDTYAISLSGEVPGDTGLAFQTELNLRPNFYDTRQCRNFSGIAGFATAGAFPNVLIPGCDVGNSNMWTYLGSVTYSAGTQLFGANKISLVFDVNAEWIKDLKKGDPTDRRQTNNPVDRGNFWGVDAFDRVITDFSWGYAAVAGLEYNNFFSNINMNPTLVFIHNVDGYQPFNSGAMVEGQRIIRASVQFTYLTRTSLEFGYSKWVGSAGLSEDSDNVSAVFKYSF